MSATSIISTIPHVTRSEAQQAGYRPITIAYEPNEYPMLTRAVQQLKRSDIDCVLVEEPRAERGHFALYRRL